MSALLAPNLFDYYDLSSENIINSVSASQDGYVYTAGLISESFMGQAYAGGGDAFVGKYDNSGNLIWARFVGASGRDEARAIAVAKDGSIYVSGFTSTSLYGEESNGQKDAFITKFNSSGMRLWTKLIGTASDDSATSVNVDANGTVYVGGWEAESHIGFISSYKSNGDFNWTQILTGNQSGVNYPEYYEGGVVRDIKTISDGSIYLAGDVVGTFFGESAAGRRDSFLTKMNPNGTQAWTRVFGSTEWEGTRGLDVSTDGSIYLVGSTNGTIIGQQNAGSVDFFVSKYDTNGNFLWSRQSGASGYDSPDDIVVGANGNIFITGSTDSETFFGIQNKAFTSAFLLEYSPNGERLSANLFSGTPIDTDTHSHSLTSTPNGLIMAGSTSSFLFFNESKPENSSANSFLLSFLYDYQKTDQSLVIKNLIFSNSLNGLYQLNNNKYAIDVTGFLAGDSLASSLILTKGGNPLVKFTGEVKSLIEYTDGLFGIISVNSVIWKEQKFSADGIALGKAAKLTTGQLLSKEIIAEQDINGDGVVGEVVGSTLDGDGDARQSVYGLYKTVAGTIVIGAAGLEATDLVGTCTALMSTVKKDWVTPVGAEVVGIAFTDDGSLEVLTLKGSVYKVREFDPLTGLAKGLAVVVKADQLEAREYYYNLDLNGDGEVSLVGQESPPIGWAI